jgi:hypothetical protein
VIEGTQIVGWVPEGGAGGDPLFLVPAD